ncbi:MAG: hypothetical protein AAFU85_13480, partial [Planctomycetota bacterium]
MSGHQAESGGVFRFVINNSLLLIAGSVAALIWANLAHQNGSHSYKDFIHFDVRSLWGGGESHADGHPPEAASGSDVGET